MVRRGAAVDAECEGPETQIRHSADYGASVVYGTLDGYAVRAELWGAGLQVAYGTEKVG